MFTQTVEYALRAMVCLAAHPGEPQSNAQIAVTTKVPSAYLSKVLQKLAKAELVHGQRGVQGGFTLARPAAETTILEIVSAVDPIQRIRTCPLGLAAHGVRLCPLHKRMDQALAQVESAFSSTTLAAILAEPGDSIPLCDFPRPRCAPVELPG